MKRGKGGGERKHGQTDRQIDGRRRFQYYSAWVHAVKDIPLRVLGPTVVFSKRGKIDVSDTWHESTRANTGLLRVID